jgi:hypothetical protein
LHLHWRNVADAILELLPITTVICAASGAILHTIGMPWHSGAARRILVRHTEQFRETFGSSAASGNYVQMA